MKAKALLLQKFKDGSFALCTGEEIGKKLHLSPRETAGLCDMLHSLVREGELLCDLRSRFGTAEQFGARRGTVTGNERGFGFFVPDDGSGDLFLPRRALKNALHGDTVLAFRAHGEDEGEVLAVLARGYTEVVGTYRRERRAGYLMPDEKRLEPVLIPAGKAKNCPDGAKAVAKIASYDGRTPIGEISEVLGRSGDLMTEELAVIRAHRLHEEFPAEVESAAAAQARQDPLFALSGREDLRDELIVTVDGEDTRDIDDAISVRKRNGLFELGVHIADVSHYVKRGSAVDREAFARGTSVYFPDRVLPMLPRALSNDICSLNEGVPRLTLSCFMTVDGKGTVRKRRVAQTVIRSRHRMTYTQMTALAKGDRKMCRLFPDMGEFVAAAVELTNILKRARERRGSIELDIKEAKILYSDGIIEIPDSERTISHEMIEQFMVLANESVAALMTEKGLPFVYRVHERPSEEKAKGFSDFLHEAGIPAGFDPAHVTCGDYAKVLKNLNTPAAPVVNRVMLRSMMKAVYSPENIGHFGLASECYCHFTSPIRRYPDLCVHRIVTQSLFDAEKAKRQFGSVVEEVATRSSACERNAADAERDVDDLYIVAYMSERIGEEYPAVISGVTSFGLFAELKNTVEGLIPLETLPGDGYQFIEEKFLLRGTKHSFRLGEEVTVRVVGVDWGSRRVQFALLGKKENA